MDAGPQSSLFKPTLPPKSFALLIRDSLLSCLRVGLSITIPPANSYVTWALSLTSSWVPLWIGEDEQGSAQQAPDRSRAPHTDPPTPIQLLQLL